MRRALLLLALLGATGPVRAEGPVLGLKVSAGGRYDDVRMCIATAAGVAGGPAADVSFFVEAPVGDDLALHVNVPVFRPLLFGLAFDMLQFEPDLTLLFRTPAQPDLDVLAGPLLGVTFHYGPDYRSESSGSGRTPSFFALGPRVGGTVGLDFLEPENAFNFMLGLTLYVSPMFATSQDEGRDGWIVGGALEGHFRWR